MSVYFDEMSISSAGMSIWLVEYVVCVPFML